jgi:hypothetical protein
MCDRPDTRCHNFKWTLVLDRGNRRFDFEKSDERFSSPQFQFRRRLLVDGARAHPTKMKDCRWPQPVLVGQFEFEHLRHSRLVGLRKDTGHP